MKVELYKKIILKNIKFIILLLLYFFGIIVMNIMIFFSIRSAQSSLQDAVKISNDAQVDLIQFEKIQSKINFFRDKTLHLYQYPIRNFNFEDIISAIRKKFSSLEEFKSLDLFLTKVDTQKVEDIFFYMANTKKDAITYDAKVKILSDHELISHYFMDAIITTMPGILNINSFKVSVDQGLMQKIIKFYLIKEKLHPKEMDGRIRTEIDFSVSITNA